MLRATLPWGSIRRPLQRLPPKAVSPPTSSTTCTTPASFSATVFTTTSSTTSDTVSPSILHSTECYPWAPTTPTIFTATTTPTTTTTPITTTTATTTSPTNRSRTFSTIPPFSPAAKSSSPPNFTRGEVPLPGEAAILKIHQNSISTIPEPIIFTRTIPRTNSYTTNNSSSRSPNLVFPTASKGGKQCRPRPMQKSNGVMHYRTRFSERPSTPENAKTANTARKSKQEEN